MNKTLYIRRCHSHTQCIVTAATMVGHLDSIL